MHAVLCFAGTLAVLFVRTMPRFSKVVPFLLIPLVALSACSSPKPSFRDDQLLSNAPSPFSHGFNYASADACEASRRALLSQGYMTTITRNDTVDATKNFQPSIDQHIVVEVHVVCTPADATNTSMVYVNAVQNGYALKKSATSASVGLSILGSISLPIHSNSDEMVKVSSATVQSDEFYKRFFDLVGRYLGSVARSEPVPGSGAIKTAPLPLPLEPTAAMVNAAAPGASTAPAAAAAAAAAAATGAAVLHTGIAPTTPATSTPPATPVQSAHAAAPAAAASGVRAVFPASPASEATLLTPVLPVAASAPAAASSAASSAAPTPAATASAAQSTKATASPAPASGAQNAAAASSITASAANVPVLSSAPAATTTP